MFKVWFECVENLLIFFVFSLLKSIQLSESSAKDAQTSGAKLSNFEIQGFSFSTFHSIFKSSKRSAAMLTSFSTFDIFLYVLINFF